MDNECRKALPGWIDDRDAEHAEADACRRLTPNERGERLAQACDLAMEILRNRPDAERALAYQAPLPDSSIELLQRLRESHRRR